MSHVFCVYGMSCKQYAYVHKSVQWFEGATGGLWTRECLWVPHTNVLPIPRLRRYERLARCRPDLNTKPGFGVESGVGAPSDCPNHAFLESIWEEQLLEKFLLQRCITLYSILRELHLANFTSLNVLIKFSRNYVVQMQIVNCHQQMSI